MTLKDIDKKAYRRKLNQVIIGFIVSLAILAIAFGAILIALFSEPLALDTIAQASINTAIESGQQTSNFRYNFLGVILALLSCAGILRQLKNTPFFNEIYYVWQLKQTQNIIYRRLKKIKKASVDGEEHALIILKFYYASLKQLYLLDDNTLTMSSLEADIINLEQLIAKNGKEITTEQFTKVLLSSYK